MSAEQGAGHSAPSWFVPPGESDHFAIIGLVILVGGIYLLVVIYAAFDRWAEHQSQGTPLAKTIPTLLAIALLYEIFPLDHFSLFLPLSAILIALMADWARFHLSTHTDPVTGLPTEDDPEDKPTKEEQATHV